MSRGALFAWSVFFGFLITQAEAHFIWIGPKPAESSAAQDQFYFYFGEAPEPGDPKLLGKISQTKAWMRAADGTATDLKFEPAADGKIAALAVGCPKQLASSLEATCDYGVYSRGPTGVLLQYYAKHLTGDWSGRSEILARAERLALDIVPSLAGNELSLLVLYKGQPSPKSEVVVVGPSGDQQELTTDSEGRVSTSVTGGLFSVRAAHIKAEQAGERDGKKYSQVWHYATLTLAAPPTSSAAVSEIPATEALRRARAGRSAWENFPGFTADLTITSGAERISGKVTIDSSGDVTLDMPKSTLSDWVEEQLQSLVQHRQPDGEVSEGKVVYADQDLTHPLGRKIELGDPGFQSAYRLKDDVIMEVNRSMGKQRFTISVLEIVRNAEHKYLPRSFTMNFFDSASGELKTSLTYWNDWQRVGNFDLPKAILEVSAGQGGAATKRIEFSNYQLAKP
jgi:uncharacterized GH25 family protein